MLNIDLIYFNQETCGRNSHFLNSLGFLLQW